MEEVIVEYYKNSKMIECENESIKVYGVTLEKHYMGENKLLEIYNISCDEKEMDYLIELMRNGKVTDMTAYEIVEDFLEI